MALKRILLIAPDHAELNWPIELEQVGSRHQVVALLGQVDQERITRATTGQRFDVIHVASHGSDAGVQLSKEWLSREQFGQIARHVRCELVFLNACNSARLAQYLIDLGLRTVMAWTVAVVDADAVRTAAYFYDELAVDDDLRKAYNKVNPRDGSLTFLAGQGYLEDVIRPLLEQLAQVGQQVGQLVNTVTTQGKALRYVAAAVVAALVVALVLVVVGVVSAQDGQVGDPLADEARLVGTDTSASLSTSGTIPVATAEASGPPVGITDTPAPEVPTAEDTPTFVPTAPLPTDTPIDPPTATDLPPTAMLEAPTATLAPSPVETATAPIGPPPTATPEPPTATNTPRPTRKPEDTPTRAPTWTKTPVASETVASETVTPTRIVWPTVTPTPSAGSGTSSATPTAAQSPTATKEYVPCYN